MPAAADTELVSALQGLTEALTKRELGSAELPTPQLVTVGSTSDPELDRRVLCRDCLDIRYAADPESQEPPTGGSRWGKHDTFNGRKRITIEHPHKPKTITYDKTAVLAGLEKGTHGTHCIQCGQKLGQGF